MDLGGTRAESALMGRVDVVNEQPEAGAARPG
jgi:hypothetical protein